MDPTLLASAAQGNPEAMTTIGLLYQLGETVPVDREQAEQWYQKAIVAGASNGYFMLGQCYESGIGRPQDFDRAAQTYQLGVDHGDDDCLYSLAACYRSGRGVPQDPHRAIELFKRAAAVGSVEAMLQLGRYYRSGRDGVEPNPEAAFDWFVAAAEADPEDSGAIGMMADAYAHGIGVAVNLELAVFWYKKLAAKGDTDAYVFLGVCYATGKGVARDFLKAGDLYRRAIAETTSDRTRGLALVNLALLYRDGRGVQQDLGAAIRLYRQAIDAGNPLAAFHLAHAYQNGSGIPKSLPHAIKWYKRAAAGGDSDAMHNLGSLYYNGGDGLAPNLSNAVYWMRKALAANPNDVGAADFVRRYDEIAKERVAEIRTNAAATADADANVNPGIQGKGVVSVETDAAVAGPPEPAKAISGRSMLLLDLEQLKLKTHDEKA